MQGSEKAEQYYPTYQSKNRDILLLEFEEAQKIANGQAKLYGQLTNILIAVTTLAITFFFDAEENNGNKLWIFAKSHRLFFAVTFVIYGYLLIRYFIELQKQITINARKVVTLRTLLGLDYGNIQLTLPNWRVEGANSPFALKYFNGWLNFKTFPMWVITFSVCCFCYTMLHPYWEINIPICNSCIPFNKYDISLKIHWSIIAFFIALAYMTLFRIGLLDRHENLYLILCKSICQLLNVKTIENFEYIIYRAKLSVIELRRINMEFENMKVILVEIEDKTFYKNNGVSFKAIGRGFASRSLLIRKQFQILQNGGSTITMQLARSLFISTQQNPYKRKFAEIIFAFWINGQFKKNEILDLYISSVRYEKGVIGLTKAAQYFFEKSKNKKLTNEEAFFLIERLSNISSTANKNRINNLLERLSINIDKNMLMRIYSYQIANGLLKEATNAPS